MDFKQAKAQVKQLRIDLDNWNYEYYVLNQPSVSDDIYDQTLQTLIDLEQEWPELVTSDSPTQMVGGEATSNFSQVTFNQPMLSLANAFDLEDLQAFDKTVQKLTNQTNVTYVCELKIDGVSISLQYIAGALQIGASRGNGKVGENITANVKQIKNLPLQLPIKQKLLEVRGEAYLTKESFIQLNRSNMKKQLPLFANPRNAAAGTLRNLDSSIIQQRGIEAFFYYLLDSDTLNINSQWEVLEQLAKWGLAVNPYRKLCRNIDEVCAFARQMEAQRASLPYDIDGIVIKVNNFSYYPLLGTTSKHPKWAIALKFHAEVQETQLLDITATVGRTGRINYNAILKPVRVAGTTLQKATLHNANFIQFKDIRIGDYLYVQKAGDIIPEVVRVNMKKRSHTSAPWTPALLCPSCQTPLSKLHDQVDQFCLNPNCQSKLLRNLEYFVSKPCMDISGLGTKKIKDLYTRHLLVNVSDLYVLKHKKAILEKLPQWSVKSVRNLLSAIEKSKRQNANRLLTALGVPRMGSDTALTLIKHFGTIDKIATASLQEMTAIKGLASIKATAIVDFFLEEHNKKLLSQLKECGLNFTYQQPAKNIYSVLTGQRIVLTGSLKRPRATYLQQLRLHGAMIGSSVSSNVNYLVVGENPGSKLQKAQTFASIKIITEQEFDDILKQGKEYENN